MTKKIGTIIGLVLVAVGAVAIWFCKIPAAEIGAFAVTMFGAGLACANLYNGAEKKNWLTIVGIAAVGIGSFVLGFFGLISSDTMVSMISMIIGIVVIIAGIISTAVGTKLAKKKEA